jgi:adenylate cyclase
LSRGGEICVSRGVHDHLRYRGGMVFEDLGEQLVKNIAHPIRAFRLRSGDAASQQEVPTPEETAEVPELPSTPVAISELSADNEVALELAFWESVKDGSPAELESYLEQYPEGTFAPLARTRLDAAALSPADPMAPTSADAAADTLDLAFWNSVKDSNRREELQAYLEQHPNGHFAGLARARLTSPDVT